MTGRRSPPVYRGRGPRSGEGVLKNIEESAMRRVVYWGVVQRQRQRYEIIIEYNSTYEINSLG